MMKREIRLARGRVWWWDVFRLNADGTMTWLDGGWNLTGQGALRRASRVR